MIEINKLDELVNNGWVYVKIYKGINRLLQAGMLAKKNLSNIFYAVDFIPVWQTPIF